MRFLGLSAAKKIEPEIATTDTMLRAQQEWSELYYDNDPQHLHFAPVLCGHVAQLATNELEYSAGSGARADWVKEMLSRTVERRLFSFVQEAAATGQVILKPYEERGQIRVQVVPGSDLYPSRYNGAGEVEAGFFADYADKYVRIERFDLQDNGDLLISNDAYALRDGGELGAAVPLSVVPRWAALAPAAVIERANRPHFVALRMPGTNTIERGSPLPVSLYAKSVGALRELDRIYQEWLHEVHTGKRKMIIDKAAYIGGDATKPFMPYTELSKDVYVILDMGADNPKPYDDYTPEMRVEAYQKAIDVQLRIIELQTGLSAGTFSIDIATGAAKTATEVISQDRTTYNTVKAIQTRAIQPALEGLVELFDLFATLYSLTPSNGKIEPAVAFGDGIFEDTQSEFARRQMMAQAGYLRPEKLLAWYFGVDEETAKAEYMPAAAEGLDSVFE